MIDIPDLLELSNHHLSEAIAAHPGPICGVTPTTCGWVIHTHGPDDASLPAGIAAITRQARSLGCDLVLLTDEADPIEAPPTPLR